MSKEIRVKATRQGYYRRLRKAGDVFDVPADLFSKSWMVKVQAEKTTAETQLDEKTIGEATLGGVQMNVGKTRKLQGAE